MIRCLVALVILVSPVMGAVDGPPKPPGEPFSPDEIKELREEAATAFALKPTTSLPAASTNAALVELGRQLYFDARLSANQSISCNSCHPMSPGAGHVAGRATSLSPYTEPGHRNAPTLLNASRQFAQGWDGRSPTVEAFLKDHLFNPFILALPDENELNARLEKATDYAAATGKAFSGSPTLDVAKAAQALSAYIASQATTDRFDRFLAGEDQALKPDELNGLYRFLLAGCAKCHGGQLLGGNSLQKLGAVNPFTGESADLGRMNVTGNPADRLVFKVPSLRNVALTAPYFHDGSRETLEDAVRDMGRFQVSKKMRPEDIEMIVSFLKTLSDSRKPSP